MIKRPVKDFWDASHHTEARKSKLKDPLELNPPRDQDNADHRPKPPSFAPGNAPNKAARGASGYQEPKRVGEKLAASNEIDITKGDPEKDLWVHGRLTSLEGYRFAAKVYDIPSHQGIDGGHISKLQIWKDDQSVAAYDRGWDQKPETDEHKLSLEKIRDVFDGRDREFTPLVAKSNDQDQGHER
ncbi:MAG: hypothetical protein ACE37E_00490 [Hyphomicrobiales bacterium]